MSDADPPQTPLARGWHDAKACYRTFWFIAPAALLATGAAVAGAMLPETTDKKVLAALAVASAAGAPFLLGVLVLLVTLALAPGRCRRAALDARLDRIESAQRNQAGNPPQQFTITGGAHTFNFGPAQPQAPGVEIRTTEGVAIGPPPGAAQADRADDDGVSGSDSEPGAPEESS